MAAGEAKGMLLAPEIRALNLRTTPFFWAKPLPTKEARCIKVILDHFSRGGENERKNNFFFFFTIIPTRSGGSRNRKAGGQNSLLGSSIHWKENLEGFLRKCGGEFAGGPIDGCHSRGE